MMIKMLVVAIASGSDQKETHFSGSFPLNTTREDKGYGLFYDQGTRSVSFEVKNDVFQICLILMFLYYR